MSDGSAALRIGLRAAAGGVLTLPSGVHRIRGDLIVDTDHTRITGAGAGTVLAFTDGGLVYDGSRRYLSECYLDNLRITRTGTPGPALRLKGGGFGTGVNRFNATNVRANSTCGQALLVDGSYIATFTGCYLTASAVGIETAADPVKGEVCANNLTFTGGETQGNRVGVRLAGAVGANFYGHAIEGNTLSGVEVAANARSIGFYGCYFEANGGWDLRVGAEPGVCMGTMVKGCFFNDGGLGKAHSIILVRSLATGIEGNCFGQAYAAEPVSVQQASPIIVTGYARDNIAGSIDGSGVVALNGATTFRI